MTKSIHQHLLPALSVALACMLSACGGGSGSAPPPPPPKLLNALADTVTASANQESILNVLGNDSDPGNTGLELVSVTAPAHGTAVLKNGALAYTPAPGYFGPDQVSYTMRAVGGTASATAEASITVTMPLRLSGKVETADSVGSVVTVAVGARAYTQTISPASGAAYDIPVTLAAPGDMVSITVQASGAANAHLKMISLAGSAGALYGASNGLGTLGRAQLADLDVTLMSTAKYVTLRRVNDGRIPANQAEFDAADARAPSQEIMQTAGVLRLISAPLVEHAALALPAGVSDTLALVLNTAAYTAFANPIVELQAPLLNAAMQSIIQEFGPQTALNVATDRERIVTLVAANTNSSAFAGTELIISPDGQAKLRVESQTYPATWRKDSDSFVVTPAAPVPFYDPGWQNLYVTTVRSYTLRQMTGGPHHGLVSLTMSIDAVADGESRFIYNETTFVSARTWDSLPALSAQDISGKTLAGLPDLIATPGKLLPSQMRVAFDANGTATLLDNAGASATWAIQDGKLRIAFADGSVQELVRHSANAGRERWLVRYSKGSLFQLYAVLMVEVQPGLSFASTAQAAQNWRSLGTEHMGIQLQFMINLLPDFSGTEALYRLDGTRAYFTPSSWTLENGQISTAIYRLIDGQKVGVCPADVYCVLSVGRRWTLLRDDGDSIVVLDRYTDSSGSQNRIIGYQRRPR